MVAGAVRAVGRSVRGQLVSYGHPQGFLPLRQQIAASLQGEGVPAHPERNLLTTNGVTHALDLIARHLVKPGDTVLVEDPAWFLIFGRLAAFGARLIGVPRGPDGPDTALLDQLAAEHKPSSSSSTARSTIPRAIRCRRASPTRSCASPSAMISWWSRTTPTAICIQAAP